MRRQYGNIEICNGRYRARARVGEQRIDGGTFANAEEADDALVLFVERARDVVPVAGHTVGSWGRKYLDKRELDGVHRGVDKERHVWKRIDASPLAELRSCR